jgi:hypothetical protein
MLIPKGEPVEVGRRGTFREIIMDFLDTDFNGYVEVSYKTDELSKGKLIFRNGNIVAAGITKILSKKNILGNSALKEIASLENCVVDIYALSSEKVEKALEWNKKASVTLKIDDIIGKLVEAEERLEAPQVEEIAVKKERDQIEGEDAVKTLETGLETRMETQETRELQELAEEEIAKLSEEEKRKLLEKYRIKIPEGEKIDEVIANLLEVSPEELTAEMAEFADAGEEVVIDRTQILQKYQIEEPSMEEVEKLIMDALGELPPPPGTVNMDELKTELKKIADEYLEKMSRKVKEVIDKCSSPDELEECISEVRRVSNSVAIFIPKKKIDEMIKEMEDLIRYYYLV